MSFSDALEEPWLLGWLTHAPGGNFPIRFWRGRALGMLVAGDVLGELNGANEFAVEECPEDDGQAEESAHGQKSKIYAQHSPKREETHCIQNQRKRCGCKYLQSCTAPQGGLGHDMSPSWRSTLTGEGTRPHVICGKAKPRLSRG